MRVGSLWAVMAVALLAAIQAVHAADGGDVYADLCVYNSDAIRVARVKKEQDGKLTELNELAGKSGEYVARISREETLRISFCGMNPVLYLYKGERLPFRDSEEAVALDRFRDVIKRVADTMSAPVAGIAAAARGVCPIDTLEAVGGVSLIELGEQLKAVEEQYSLIPEYIDRTRNPSDPALANDRKSLSGSLTGARRLRAAMSASSRALVRTQDPVALQFRRDTTTVLFGTRSQYLDSIGDRNCVSKAQDDLGAKLRDVAQDVDRFKAMLRTLETFNTAFQAVGSNKVVDSIAFNARGEQPEKITIENNPAFAELYSDDTRKFVDSGKGVGSATINVAPQLALHLSIAPGVIYSFVKQPKFSAKSDGAGAFTIAQEESNYTAAGGMVAFNITRDKYMKELVRPFLQVGISPKKDELAFLLGIGLALDENNKTLFSLGAIYQERQKLGGGLSVGGTLASEDDLKLDTEFKFGFYAGLSYNIEITK